MPAVPGDDDSIQDADKLEAAKSGEENRQISVAEVRAFPRPSVFCVAITLLLRPPACEMEITHLPTLQSLNPWAARR